MDHVAQRSAGRAQTRFGTLARLALALFALASLAGCAGSYGYSSYGEPVGYTTVTSVPYDVYSYPNTYYNGRTVYYVDNRWMYNDGARWVYYQNEPAPLYRYRSNIQQAPPARRYYPAAPPAMGAPPPGAYPPSSAPHGVAPPATRVR